jgi:hypothetical protein
MDPEHRVELKAQSQIIIQLWDCYLGIDTDVTDLLTLFLPNWSI